MSGPFHRILAGVCFFVFTCLVAILGYVIAGWNVMDAVYMVIITIFGVGYGEVHPITTPGMRVFTNGVIVAGYAAAIYAVGGFIQLLTEGEINRALGARRMTRGIDRLTGHTIVCGYGRIGRILAEELAHGGEQFVVIDADIEKIRAAESLDYLVINGDATEEEILQKAGIDRAKSLASVLPNDSANVFITLTANELNPNIDIVARCDNPSTEKKLIRSGAKQVILPMVIGAQRMAHLILRPTAETLLEQAHVRSDLNEELTKIGLQLGEVPVPPDSPLVGKSIEEMEIRGSGGFLVVAIRDTFGQAARNPLPERIIAVGDTVIVVGHENDLPQLMQKVGAKKEIFYRGAKVSVS